MIAPFCRKARAFIQRPPAEDAFLNVLQGSIRSGKTWAMIPKILALCHYKVAGKRVMMGVSKSTVYNNILGDLFEFVGSDNYSYSSGKGHLTLFGTQWLIIGAKDEGSEKYIRGLTVGLAVIDEATLIPESSFTMLLSRMSPAGARAYCTTNPDSPFHYLKAKYLDDETMRARGDVWSEHFVLQDNLSLTPAKIAQYEAMYHGVFYQRFIKGLWVIAQGAVYGDAITDENFYTDATAPVGLRAQGGHVERIIAVDYGTTNPCTFIDAYDDGKRVYWDREYYWDSKEQMRQKTDSQYADDLIEFMGGNAAAAPVVLDPSAASFRAELTNRGVFVIDADNEVDDGIRMVSTMLSRKLIVINKDRCPKGVRELQSYSWDERAGKSGKEKPIKSHDHFPDAGRYHIKTRIPAWRLTA